MKRLVGILSILIMVLTSCKNKPEVNPYDEVIKNPLTAKYAMDTVNIPKLYFPEPKHDFGYVNEGDSIVHEFLFYNKGKAKLLISNVSTSCGCTVPKLYKDQLEPGDSSKLKVVFNTTGKVSYQEKIITIFANTFPTETSISLNGYIVSK